MPFNNRKLNSIRLYGYTAHYTKKHDVIHKTGSIVTTPEEDQATAIGNMHKIR